MESRSSAAAGNSSTTDYTPPRSKRAEVVRGKLPEVGSHDSGASGPVLLVVEPEFRSQSPHNADTVALGEMGVQAGEPHSPVVHPRLSSDYCVLWCKCTHIQINIKTGLKDIANHTQDSTSQQASSVCWEPNTGSHLSSYGADGQC